MSRRHMGVAWLAILLMLALDACGGRSAGPGTAPPATGGKDDIRIGILLPFTGPLSALGIEMFNGYEAARTWTNQHGGINGRQITFVRNDAPTPQDAVGATEKLIVNDKVTVIMGSYSSGISIPASEVANRNGVVYWETGGVAAEITNRGLKYLFRTVASTDSPAYADALPTFIKEKVSKELGTSPVDLRLGVIHEDSAFGQSGVDSFRAGVKKHGLNLVAEQPYTANTSDLSSVIQNLIAKKVQVVYCISYVNDAILFMRQSKELGFQPQLIIGGGAGFTTPAILEALGKEINGVVASGGAPVNISDKLISTNVKPSYTEFISHYESLIHRKPLEHATLGFVGAMVLFQEVLPKVPDLNPDKLVEAAAKVDIPDGGTVAVWGIKFDQKHQNTRATQGIHQYQNGILVPVWPDAMAAGSLVLPMSQAPGR